MSSALLPGRRSLAAALCAAAVACTYGPAEETATASQVVRLGDAYMAVALVEHDVFQRPTGISTFPDGGRWRFVDQRALLVQLDVGARTATPFAAETAPDSLWESFESRLVGVEADSAVYLRMTGCPRGGQCYPDLMKVVLLRVTLDGGVEPANSVPDGAALPGTMLARAPGEQVYVRFTTRRDTIAVRTEDEGPYVPMFLVSGDGGVRSTQP